MKRRGLIRKLAQAIFVEAEGELGRRWWL